MAKLGDLVVRIGADTRDLNKSLGKVQRNMRSMTSNFKKLGMEMTKAITLPILGIGAMAVKSAADLEKMEVGFISLTGGAKQAGDMMKQLNEFTAKTPFQIDAIATSARQLIASGTDISKVNEQLQFLGDIAATTGQPINEIAAIFAKVNAKGKVELENLNQLAERGIPVFKGLADATGLLPSELGAGAVTVKQFNDYLKGLAEEGGIAEGAMERLSETASGKFSTALDNLKLAGAALAEDLLPIIKELLDKVVSLAQKFTGLSDSTKKNILIFGGLLAALGPLLIVVPSLISGVTALGGALGVAAGPVGWIALGVVALTAGMIALQAANHNALSSIEKAEKATREQTTEVRHLIEAYKDEGKSLGERERILKRLQEIDATHFGNLDAENTKYGDLVKSLDEYTKGLRKVYLEKAFADEGKALFKRLAVDESYYIKKLGLLKESEDELRELRRTHSRQGRQAQLSEQIKLQKETLKLAKGNRDKVLQDIDEFEKSKQALLKKYASVDPDFIDPGDKGGIIEVITPKQMELIKALPIALIAVDQPLKTLQQSTSTVADGVVEDLQSIIDAGWEFADGINAAISSGVASMLSGMAEMVGAAVGAEKPLEGLGIFIGEMLAQMAINIGQYAIAHGTVIEAIKASLTSLEGVGAIVAGMALIALGAGLKSAIQKSAENAGVPALAEGGLMYGPSLIVAGDNKNANIDPEVVAPLSKLKDLLGGNSIQVYGRISGDDIVISNNRASRDRNRF